MAPVREEVHGAGTTGMAAASGLPCTMFYGLYALSPGTGVLAPVIRAMREHHRKLGISSGMPGPHDFTVRESLVRPHGLNHAARSRVHRIPRSTLVTIAKRPSRRARDDASKHQFPKKRK
jgi:hypothetical protein